MHCFALRLGTTAAFLGAVLGGCALPDDEAVTPTADTGWMGCGPHAPEMDDAEVWWGTEADHTVLVITTVVDDPDGALHEIRVTAWGDAHLDGAVDTAAAPLFVHTIDLLSSDRIEATECATFGGFPLLITVGAAELPGPDELAELALQVTDADHHPSQVVVRPVCSEMGC